jgi:hypothetical protein|nr:MAG TPA: hypothetical protein [Caudoviricetes sp.]
MIKIAIIYFIVVMLMTLLAYIIDLYNDDKEFELLTKRVILLIMGWGIIFLMFLITKTWAKEVRSATTYMEIFKTTLINGFYFIISIFLGSTISRKMEETREKLYNIRLEKLFENEKGENFE